MTKEEMDAIRKRVEAATVGPWDFRATEHGGGIKFVVAPNERRNANGTEFVPADCSHGFNGLFIAHAREDMPRLLDEVERLEREIALRKEQQREDHDLFEACKIQWAAIKENADRACGENARLREALEYYTDAESDHGARARAALEKS